MKRNRLALLLAFGIIMILPMIVGSPNTHDINLDPLVDNDFMQPYANQSELAGAQDQAEWWNSSFIYRRYLNFTEPDVSDRTLVPVHLYLTFTSGHCYRDSIRVEYYNSPGWTDLPFQTWNTTYDGDFVLSTTISFMVNVSQNDIETNYYLYYAKEDVGSVSYPDFYPFVYKSYTFSLLNLVSFYDENNYYVEMWDSSDQAWKDPRDVDSVWSADTMTPDNVPNGTLNRMQNVRYEPNSYSYTNWHGFYAVYSNYPLAVSVGQGDKGSNPAINDWFPAVSQIGTGTDTEFILGGVEGFEDKNEGKYWIQAQTDDTEVYVWTSDGSAETASNWQFHNGSSLAGWPAKLSAGEYISRRDVVYTVYLYVNATKPVSARFGDSDSSYARDILGLYPAIDGKLSGEEFYTIDMGHSYDYTRVTNLGDSAVDVDYWRNAGSGWGSKTTERIGANSSVDIPRGSAGSGDQEDILHIKGESGANLMVYGVYRPDTPGDAGDWVPSLSGDRYGSSFKMWGNNGWKFMIVATENARVEVSGYNSGTLSIPAGGAAAFRPLSSSATLYHINSNASVSVVLVGKFSTSSPYNPTGDTGYGWMVPTFNNDADENALAISISDEIHLFEFDVTVEDLDGFPVEGATVTLYNASDGTLWVDDNGLNRTGTTDSNGLVVFEGLSDGDYTIRTEIDAKSWLTTSYAELWVQASPTESITGPVTPVTVTLPMGSFSIYMKDLMGDAMAQTPDETTTLRMSNESDSGVYSAQVSTNSSGWANFYRIPQDDYTVFASYNGNVSSYTYEQIADFGSWSIASDEFSSSPFQHSWTMPLVTIRLDVVSWDDQPVQNAYVTINNTAGPEYDLTRKTNADGKYNFHRVVNGSWYARVEKHDDYSDTPIAYNNSIEMLDIQGEHSQTVGLAITRLNVKAQISDTSPVQGAQVNVTLVGIGVVAQGSTNSTGYAVFYNIHGNMSSPQSVSYTVVIKSGETTTSAIVVRCDYNWTYVNVITLPTDLYDDLYSELNSTAYFASPFYGQHVNFTVGFYDRDGSVGSPEDKLILFDSSSWVNFTIYFSGNPIGSGTWNWSGSNHVYDQTGGLNFTIQIDTLFWKMNVSDTAYIVIVSAHDDSVDDPTPLTFYITVKATSTTLGKSTSAIDDYYKTHEAHDFWLSTSIPSSMNLADLDGYTYLVKLGATNVSWGSLVDAGEFYTLPASALHGLPVGFYTVTIALSKQNYVNRTVVLDVTIDPVPMRVDSLIASSYFWDTGSEIIAFDYINDLNSSNPELSGITVTLQWFTSSWVSIYNMTPRTLSPTLGTYTTTFPSDLLDANADYFLRVTCSKSNYETAAADSLLLHVSPAPTTLDLITSSAITVDWLDTGVFDLSFVRDSGIVGLSGASVTSNWTQPMSVSYQGSGVYRLGFDTSAQSDTYTVSVEFSLANHENAEVQVDITILIPLLVETSFGSAESPLETYWTHTFDINVTLFDQSRTDTPVDGAGITYSWYMESVIDQSGTLTEGASGLYYVTLNANNALPNDLSYIDDYYTIVLTAEKAGCTTTVSTIYVVISSTPNEIILDQDYYEQFYDDTFDVLFYWNNTLDNLPITEIDTATCAVLGISANVTTGVNSGDGWYTFSLNTRDLGMTAAVQGSVYVVRITMTRSGFEPHELTTAVILIREAPTALIIDEVDEVNWSNELQLVARLWDTEHNVLVDGAAAITLTVPGTGYTQLISNNGSGIFTWIIQTDDWFSGSTEYSFEFSYTLDNYVDGTNSTDLYVRPIPAVITKDVSQTTPISVVWGEEFDLRVNVNQDYGSLDNPINGLTVMYTWQGTSVSGIFSGIGNGGYLTTVNSSQISAGEYIIVVHTSNKNYTFSSWTVEVTVEAVTAGLYPSQSTFEGIYGGPAFTVRLTYNISSGMTFAGRVLRADEMISDFAGGQAGTWDASTATYRFVLDPTTLDSSLIPGIFTVNFTATLDNYTTATTQVTLHISASTSLTVPNIQVQIDDSVTIYVNYFDTTKNQQVPFSAVTSLTLTTPMAEFTKDDFAVAEDGRYYIEISPLQIGEISSDPYAITVSIVADGYESHIGVTAEARVIETQFTIPLVVTTLVVPQSQLFLFLLMLGGFIVVGSVVTAVRRWRVPYQIKQINAALKKIADNKAAKVEGIKDMGAVVSDLLAPGLADLDIQAPRIEVTSDLGYEEMLDEDTEDLLGELDALDEVGAEGADDLEAEMADYEAELEAEMDSIEAEAEAEPEPEVESVEEPTEDLEPEGDAEADIEPEEEAEPELEETSEADAEPEEEAEADAEPEIEDELEPELESSEDEAEDKVEEVETVAEEEPSEEDRLKMELIETLPDEIREAFPTEELMQLSAEELRRVLESKTQDDEE